MDMMELRDFGDQGLVSALSLGGGGLGQVWGNTTRREAVATVEHAIASGITLLDMAPLYGNGEAESVIGEAFNGRLPADVRITTKVMLGNPPMNEVRERLRDSLTASLRRLRLEQVDYYILHGNLIPPGYRMQRGASRQDEFATPWTLFTEIVRPSLEDMKAEGLIGGWGISGIGLPKTILAALQDQPRPAVVQICTNLLDSVGAMKRFEGDAQPRRLLETAVAEGVPVMGIRAVQAGALCDRMDRDLPADHPDRLDFERAQPFRRLARELGVTAATLAYRYALDLPGVSTIVLGVKNREELDEAIAAAAEGPLPQGWLDAIEALGLRAPRD